MINFDPVDLSGFSFRLYRGKNYEAMQKYEPKHLSSNKTDNKSQVSIYENLISVCIFNA